MTSPNSFRHGTVIDILGDGLNSYLLERIQSSLIEPKQKGTVPYLPEEFIFLKEGPYIHSKLYHHEKCYQTHDEKQLFRQNGKKIAEYIPENSLLIDLGSGDLRKVDTLLSVLEAAQKPVTYLALDLDKPYLQHEISKIAETKTHVLCQGVCGTYAHAVEWCASLPGPRVFLWLGSTLFRISRAESLATLKAWTANMRPDDIILAGVDGHTVTVPGHQEKIWDSYHSDEDVWWQLWMNGFVNINELVGEEWFRGDDWRRDAEIVTEPITQHRFKFHAARDVTLGSSGVAFREGEELGWLDAHKFTESDVRDICKEAGLVVVEAWKAEGSEMAQYLIKLNDDHRDSSI